MRAFRIALVPLVALFTAAGAQAQTQPAAPQQPITLAAALQMAKANAVQFRAAQADAVLAREDRLQARAALLPSVTYNNQFIYTQGNGTTTARYLANNGVHEYISQGNVHQVVGLGEVAAYRKAEASAALARAKAEVAARGLVVTVVHNYYAALAAAHRQSDARAAADEATAFLDLSRKLEAGGEVARADVLKAQLQFNDRKRDLDDAAVDVTRSKLDLGVLILPALADYQLADDLDEPPALPELAEVQRAAAVNNPDLRAALAALQASQSAVTAARALHLPSLGLDYYYGIDASHFATRTDGVHNLGYAAVATLNIPIFNWGAVQSQVRQSQIHQDQAKLELTTAQKQLLADIESGYAEAQAANAALATLRESLDLAVESLRLTRLRYEAGESTVLEVVDAQTTLNSARNAKVDGALRYRLALAELQTLTGTL